MSNSESVESEEVPIPSQHSKGATVERDGHSPFPVVGIGASAGGLEAFTQLLSNLPADTGMAFVLVQHLDPRHESRLTDLLAKATRMPVLEAAHGLAVRPNHVYVIPPNANLALALGILHITPRGEGRAPHLPVDYLFRSLAEDQRAKAIGVVLSGTGSDGTLGLCEIKAVGGIAFAQEELSAKHPGMPNS
ncbi:MAG TPA: chemotaxis protein CheB, partial [Gemmataceae bacterium]|nr:chemotaxis protein CheB [Gemmataceae bacterium]